MKKAHMKTADPSPAELSPELLDEIRRLQAMPESSIDTDDIPEADRENMKQGYRGPQFKPVKAPITIRLDTDVIAWFKENAENGRYQSAMNRALREFMARTRKKSA